ncbi:unnamed protein product [Acanthosepion pharaonis]|uniref:Uncharacterized protein n=1 Tax=Acanthosepion pharaonis TaxID=158019 RepID=A0A812DTS0_ACAPH|nr:unnamed protein product [Sepia pharaonis]
MSPDRARAQAGERSRQARHRRWRSGRDEHHQRIGDRGSQPIRNGARCHGGGGRPISVTPTTFGGRGQPAEQQWRRPGLDRHHMEPTDIGFFPASRGALLTRPPRPRHRAASLSSASPPPRDTVDRIIIARGPPPRSPAAPPRPPGRRARAAAPPRRARPHAACRTAGCSIGHGRRAVGRATAPPRIAPGDPRLEAGAMLARLWTIRADAAAASAQIVWSGDRSAPARLVATGRARMTAPPSPVRGAARRPVHGAGSRPADRACQARIIDPPIEQPRHLPRRPRRGWASSARPAKPSSRAMPDGRPTTLSFQRPGSDPASALSAPPPRDRGSETAMQIGPQPRVIGPASQQRMAQQRPAHAQSRQHRHADPGEVEDRQRQIPRRHGTIASRAAGHRRRPAAPQRRPGPPAIRGHCGARHDERAAHPMRQSVSIIAGGSMSGRPYSPPSPPRRAAKHAPVRAQPVAAAPAPTPRGGIDRGQPSRGRDDMAGGARVGGDAALQIAVGPRQPFMRISHRPTSRTACAPRRNALARWRLRDSVTSPPPRPRTTIAAGSTGAAASQIIPLAAIAVRREQPKEEAITAAAMRPPRSGRSRRHRVFQAGALVQQFGVTAAPPGCVSQRAGERLLPRKAGPADRGQTARRLDLPPQADKVRSSPGWHWGRHRRSGRPSIRHAGQLYLAQRLAEHRLHRMVLAVGKQDERYARRIAAHMLHIFGLDPVAEPEERITAADQIIEATGQRHAPRTQAIDAAQRCARQITTGEHLRRRDIIGHVAGQRHGTGPQPDRRSTAPPPVTPSSSAGAANNWSRAASLSATARPASITDAVSLTGRPPSAS